MENEREKHEAELIPPDLIKDQLHGILESRHFRSSRRSTEFLRYVVEQTLAGRTDLLKERLIGTELFGRNSDYSTSGDSVVRVQAGDVRRRLALYYATEERRGDAEIELPLGSYIPTFRLRPLAISAETPVNVAAETDGSPLSKPVLTEGAHVEPSLVTPSQSIQSTEKTTMITRQLRLAWLLVFLLSVTLLIVLSVLPFRSKMGDERRSSGVLDLFWAPLRDTHKPILLCLGHPMLYRPSRQLFDQYIKQHPGEFQEKVDRETVAIPFQPSELIRADEMRPIINSGPAIGGVLAAINFTMLFTKQDQPFRVRFGREVSFADLRDTNAVVVGAFNSPMLIELTDELRFSFSYSAKDNATWIQDKEIQSRRWYMKRKTPTQREFSCDYAIITRQLTSRTGAFLVSVAGISDGGTQTASEVVTSADTLSGITKALPATWSKKNMQLVITNDLTVGKPSSPALVAYALW